MQHLQHLHRRKVLALLPLFGQTETAMKQLLQRADLLKFPVGILQNSLVFVVKPVTLPMQNIVQGLRIELPVIYHYICADGVRHFYTDKATAAAGVRKQVLMVARADERGIAPHLLDAGAVWLAKISGRLLQQMLQETLLALAYLVKFIHIYQQEAPQMHLCIALALEIQTVRIAETQLRRQDDAAKRRLATPLRTYQQR